MSTTPEKNPDFLAMLSACDFRTQHLFRLFDYGHLPEGAPRLMSAECCGLAIQMIWNLGDGEELWVGLRKLLEAKDCFVRQAVVDERR
jgi:uncharacterized protein